MHNHIFYLSKTKVQRRQPFWGKNIVMWVWSPPDQCRYEAGLRWSYSTVDGQAGDIQNLQHCWRDLPFSIISAKDADKYENKTRSFVPPVLTRAYYKQILSNHKEELSGRKRHRTEVRISRRWNICQRKKTAADERMTANESLSETSQHLALAIIMYSFIGSC